MNEQDLHKWLATPDDYQKGISIYEQCGGNKTQIELFRKYDNSYCREKLWNLLDEVRNKLSQPVIVKGEPQADFLKIPDGLKELQIEKGRLYAEIFPFRKALKEEFKKELKSMMSVPGSLTVRDACEQMTRKDRHKRPIPFSIAFVTWNKETGQGGELVYFEHATLSQTNGMASRNYPNQEVKKKSKQPNHWMNSTRNILPLASNEPKKLHIWLMLMFDGMEVTMGDAG
jgi:hypothetical protein